MMSLMAAADVVVAMGGYNTVCELLTLRKRAVLVPRVQPGVEQCVRAERMAAMGLLRMVHPIAADAGLVDGRHRRRTRGLARREQRPALRRLDGLRARHRCGCSSAIGLRAARRASRAAAAPSPTHPTRAPAWSHRATTPSHRPASQDLPQAVRDLHPRRGARPRTTGRALRLYTLARADRPGRAPGGGAGARAAGARARRRCAKTRWVSPPATCACWRDASAALRRAARCSASRAVAPAGAISPARRLAGGPDARRRRRAPAHPLHLHAGRCGRAVASGLSGLPFSISAHAKDIYLSDAADLRRKLHAARFTVTCTDFNCQTLRQIAPRGAGAPHVPRHRPPGVSPAPPRARCQLVPLILSVGRLREKKGLDTLIHRLRAAAPARPAVPLRDRRLRRGAGTTGRADPSGSGSTIRSASSASWRASR